MREYVVMWERAVGNGEVGSMWTETAVFPETAMLSEIETWIAKKRYGCAPESTVLGADGRVTIQIAQRPNDEEPGDD